MRQGVDPRFGHGDMRLERDARVMNGGADENDSASSTVRGGLHYIAAGKHITLGQKSTHKIDTQDKRQSSQDFESTLCFAADSCR